MTSIVSSPIKMEKLPGNRRRLWEDFVVDIDDMRFVVPAGFVWDGASIPKFAWSRFGHPFDDIHCEPALWHDAAYSGLFEGMTKGFADSIYRRWIQANGQTKLRGWLEWLAILAFGGSHWDAAFVIGSLVMLSLALSGCATKSRNVDMDGMYLSETGTLAIGSIEIQSAPIGEETVSIKYTEDNAWLKPSMKKHDIKILMTGANSVDSAAKIVKSICDAFTAVNNTVDKSNE